MVGYSSEYKPEVIQRILEGPYKIYGHNIFAADLPILRRNTLHSTLPSILPVGKIHDTMLSAHVTHGHLAGEGSYDLRSVCLLYDHRLNLEAKQYATDIFGTCRYDAAHTLYVGQIQDKIIDRDGLRPTWETSHRIAPIFQTMYEKGVRLDATVLQANDEWRAEETARILGQLPQIEKRKEYKKKPAKVWQEPLNMRSPAVIKWFAEHGVKLAGRSREDFEKVVRSKKRIKDEVRHTAQLFVQLSELGSDSFWLGERTETGWEKVDANGFCHPEYKITGTPDRTSCVGVNIENFPRPKGDPRRIPLRAAVIPPEDGMILLACDARAIESITTALEAEDKARLEYVLGRDYHQETADKLNAAFSLGMSRQEAKSVNHAFDKGESPFNLSSRLGINSQMADEIIQAQLRQFPTTAAFRQQLWDKCRQNPVVVRNKFGRKMTCFGRSRMGEDSGSWGMKCRRDTFCSCRQCAPIRERYKTALAFLGRSTAVDIVFRKQAAVCEQGVLDNYSLSYIHCHDEIVWALPVEKAGHYQKIGLDFLHEPVPELGMSFPFEGKLGTNWAQCK